MNTAIEIVNVGLKTLHPDAKMPVYSSDEAAGADLHSIVQRQIMPHARALIPTGIAIELPAGFEAQVRPRSGLALKSGITVLNTPGTIDSDYRGEIGVILLNTSDDVFTVNVGDRVAQLVVAPIVRARFLATGGVLSQTTRGVGGFGSTGIKAIEPVYLNDWADGGEGRMLEDFEISKEAALGDGQVIIASYSYEDYTGSAFVLLRRDGKLYEVHGSHCSCYGLEGQWELEETSVEALRHRLEGGTWGEEDRIKKPILEALEKL